MGRCCLQIVMGPAGSGKSTYCHAVQEHFASLGRLRRRSVHIANLDPAAENFNYDVSFDIRELISVDEVMEELGLGPNGALIYCMEYLLENLDWLRSELDGYEDDECHLLLDCPGQIELYTHVPIMRKIVDEIRMWGYESSMVAVFVADATFVCDSPKFISGSLLSMSTMIALELPHVNVMSKCDMIDEEKVEKVLETESAIDLWNREEDHAIRETALLFPENLRNEVDTRRRKRNKLTESICQLLDDYSMVSFYPLNIKDEESVDLLMANIENSINFAEGLECRGAEMDDTEIMEHAENEDT